MTNLDETETTASGTFSEPYKWPAERPVVKNKIIITMKLAGAIRCLKIILQKPG
jgi:hypothetical protein